MQFSPPSRARSPRYVWFLVGASVLLAFENIPTRKRKIGIGHKMRPGKSHTHTVSCGRVESDLMPPLVAVVEAAVEQPGRPA